MKEKLYYVPGHHRLVFIHDEDEILLLLGGMCQYLNDAKTNILRQVILKKDFEKYKPILVNENHLEQYRFLTYFQWINKPLAPVHWKVTPERHNSGIFLYLAKKVTPYDKKLGITNLLIHYN